MTPLEHVPLAPRTTLGVGGAARFFVEVATEADVARAIAWARDRDLPLLVLGGGSNLLVADRGFEGLVLRPRLEGVSLASDGERGEHVTLDAAAGEPWDAVVARAVAEDLAGLECLSGIPGDTGATPIQNVGAYGQEVADTIVHVRAVDRVTGERVELPAASCGFGYRDSVFKRAMKDRYVVTGARFRLRRGGPPRLAYAELAARFASRAGTASPSLAEVRAAVLELRRAKSMILDPDAENGRSAGSFFMNPTVDLDRADRIQGLLTTSGTMPRFPAPDGRVKLSAGWLIERAGFVRGTSDGRVGLSTKHALAIVNKGGATAREIVAFAARVQAGVRDAFGVTLHPEPVLVGFAPGELGRLEVQATDEDGRAAAAGDVTGIAAAGPASGR